MIQFLLIVIFISAALSLLSYIHCWQDICRGRPHIISLRQITSVMDREWLNRRFGAHEPGYYYKLSPAQIQDIVRKHGWFFYCECAMDTVCLFGAWWFSIGLGSGDMALLFILLAGAGQGLNVAYSFWLMRKWKHQIREEIENSED